MAWVDFKDGFIPWLPPVSSSALTTFNTTTLIMSANGDEIAIVGQVPKSGVLDKFETHLGAVAVPPTNGLRFAFRDGIGVSPTPLCGPDTTDDQYHVETTGLTAGWFAPGIMTDNGDSGTGVKRAVTAGELLACVIKFESFVALDSVVIGGFAVSGFWAFPYTTRFTSSAWTAPGSGIGAHCVLKYDDGSYESFPGSQFASAVSAGGSTGLNSAPDERALLFQVPFRAKLGGCIVQQDLDQPCNIVLYASDGTTVLATASINPRISASGQHRCIQFATPVELSANTDYYLAIKATSATLANIAYYLDYPSTALMGAMYGGANWRYAEQTDAGGWTPTATRRLAIYPKFSSVFIGGDNVIFSQPRIVR